MNFDVSPNIFSYEGGGGLIFSYIAYIVKCVYICAVLICP